MPEREYSVRFATRDDVGELVGLVYAFSEYAGARDEAAVTAESLEQALFADRRAEALLVVHDGVVVGYAMFFQGFSSWRGRGYLFLEEFFLLEAHRSKGAGGMVLSRLASLCRERGFDRMEWCCPDKNTASLAFYVKNGAKRFEALSVYWLSGPALDRLAKYCDKSKG